MAILRSAFTLTSLTEALDIRAQLSALHTSCVYKDTATGSNAHSLAIEEAVGDTASLLGSTLTTPPPGTTLPDPYFANRVPAYRDLIRALRTKTGLDRTAADTMSRISAEGELAVLDQLETFLAARGWTSGA